MAKFARVGWFLLIVTVPAWFGLAAENNPGHSEKLPARRDAMPIPPTAAVNRSQEPELPKWRRELLRKAETLSGRQRDIAMYLTQPPVNVPPAGIIRPGMENLPTPPNPKLIFGWRDDMTIAELFDPNCDAYRAFSALIGEENTALIPRLYENRANYSFSYPESQYKVMPTLLVRSKNRRLGLDADFLYDYVCSFAAGFTPEEYLDELIAAAAAPQEGKPFNRDDHEQRMRLEKIVPPLIGTLLDDPACAPELMERIGKLSTKDIVYQLSPALLASRNADAHAIVGKLLVDLNLRFSAYQKSSSTKRRICSAQSLLVRRSVTSTLRQPRSGATNMKRLHVPFRTYSVSKRSGLPGSAAMGGRVSPMSCLGHSSMQTRGCDESLMRL